MKKRCKRWPEAVTRVFLWLSLPAVAAAMQLPPEIQADRYLLEAEKEIQAKDYRGAKEAMDRILRLEAQHGLQLPEEFFFRYAEVSDRLGLSETVVDFLTKYLTLAGQDGENYREALEMLAEAEASVEAARRRAEEARKRAEAAAEAARKEAEEERRRAEAAAAAGALPTCEGQAEGAACWMELESHPTFCFVWNANLKPGGTATWTGECSGGLAQGTGKLIRVWNDGKTTLESTGHLQDGKRYGSWIFRAKGDEAEGPYVEGKRHGRWVFRMVNGTVGEGSYLDGELTGNWVERLADGTVLEGLYADGKKSGHWVEHSANGTVLEGPYADGKKNGHWVERSANGTVWEGSYVDGGRHGGWVFRWADGAVFEGPFVDGELTGDWVLRMADGTVLEGPYAYFGRHNTWIIRWPNGGVLGGSYQEARRKTEAEMAALEEAVEEARGTAAENRRRYETAISGMEFVWVPPGEFRMGSTSRKADDDERPRMRVRISRGFFLGKYEVTQGQWEAVMWSNPSYFKQCGPDCPVDTVSWNDVQKFIARLNAVVGEERYRLPTEAEWEYAARAGTGGDRYGNLDETAWYAANSGRSPHPVGGKAPNAWGLYDMLGNVWEWTQDWYGNYPGGSLTDPRGPGSGSSRVYRGGSWLLYARFCRASDRLRDSPGSRSLSLGFRLLRTE